MAHRRRNVRRRPTDEPGHAHELTFTCYHRHRFLAAERTCRWLADAIEAAGITQDFALWAYVFMPDHVHLVVWPRRPTYAISAILKAVKEPVGRRAIAHLEEHRPEWLDRVTRRRGDRTERLFWQSGGGYDRNISETRTLQPVIDYVHQNPVRRGLVARPSDWLWSSAGWYETGEPAVLVPDRIPPEWTSGWT